MLEENRRTRSCCCCSIKAGTTIVTILSILCSIMNIITVYLITNDDEKENDSPMMSQIRGSWPPMSIATKVIMGIISFADVTVAGVLIYKNCNDKPKYMTCVFYWWLAEMVVGTIFQIFMISTLADSGLIILRTVSLFIGTAIALLFLYVLRSRVADIQEQKDQCTLPYHKGLE